MILSGGAGVRSITDRHRERLRERARERARDRAPTGPLRDYLSAAPPPRHTPLGVLPLLAVDFETTGLDPRTAHIVSIGLVPVDGRAIRLDGARTVIVRPPEEVGDSAVVHGLTDDVVDAGTTLESALALVLSHLAGRLLLAHYSVIETGFLSVACERVYGQPVRLPSVDTLLLQERILSAGLPQDREPTAGSLRLWAARERYGLPVYPAHDALVDALACAELYLAQTAELEARRSLVARQVVARRGP